MKAPAYYEDKARAAAEAGDYQAAARHWGSARAASIGHSRRARYERAQESALEKAALQEGK